MAENNAPEGICGPSESLDGLEAGEWLFRVSELPLCRNCDKPFVKKRSWHRYGTKQCEKQRWDKLHPRVDLSDLTSPAIRNLPPRDAAVVSRARSKRAKVGVEIQMTRTQRQMLRDNARSLGVTVSEVVTRYFLDNHSEDE